MSILVVAVSCWFLVDAVAAFLKRPISTKWRAVSLALLLVTLASVVPLTSSGDEVVVFPHPIFMATSALYYWPVYLAAGALLVSAPRLLARNQFMAVGVLSLCMFAVSSLTLVWLQFLQTTPVS